MTTSLTAEAIILAINSAIKLGDRLQRAYANSIKAKAILLPLPQFDTRPNFERAHRFFKFEEQGQTFCSRIERIQHLFDEQESFGLGSAEQDEYVDYYIQLHFQLEKDRRSDSAEDAEINLDSLLALLQVRQWESGKAPRNSPVKLVAGTLVEIGIDYFNQVPGALNPKSSLGRVMQHFLSAVDDIEIAESEDLQQLSEQLVPQLFIAAAESVQSLSKDISSDEKIQAFIAATSKNIADDLIRRTRDQDPAHTEEAVRWGQLVLRSMVKNAGHYVFGAPAEFFRTNEGASNLIKATGNVILDAVLSDPHQLDLKHGFNIDTLDRLVRSALQVVAEHPKMISGKDGVREVVMGVSAAMAEAGIKNRPDLLPELVRIILEHTADNFQLIVRGGPGEPGKHLLVIAIQQLLLAISRPVPEGRWKLRLPKGQLISIAENILDEVVMNPDWVLATVEDKTLLQETLDATFQALAGLPKDQRLNKEMLEMIIRVNIRTVVTNQGVLSRVHWGTEEQEVVILQKGLDLVFHFVFASGTVAPAERIHLLSELLRYTSKVILAHHPDERGLLLIDMILFQDPNVDYSAGFNPKLADDLINAALIVLQTHPELVSGQVSLQHILSGVAGALHASSFKKAGILSELARLSLLYTAENIHLIILSEEEEPKYLLVMALRQLLSTLTVKADTDHWQPRLTAPQLLAITENIFDQVVHHPQWLIPDDGGDTVFGAVLEATFSALRALPKEERLKAKTLEMLVQLSLATAVGHPQVLDRVAWGEEEEEAAILQHVINLAVSFVFERTTTTGGERLQLLVDLLHYILEIFMSRYPNKKGLLLLDLILFEDPDVDFSQGFQPELYDRLIEAAIKVLDYRPDLLTNDRLFQHLIEVIMGALKKSGYKQPGILPELLRIVLECTSENVQLIIKTEEGDPKYLLAVALTSLLDTLSEAPANSERWSPQLSTPQLLGVVEDVLDFLVIHPQLLTEGMREGTIFSETLNALFRGLRELPKSQRLKPDSLEWLLRTSLQAAASSRELLSKIKWGPDEEEAIILEKALELVFAYAFPENGPSRAGALEDLLEYVLEFIIRHHKDKKAIMLLYLILFEWPELGPRPLPQDREVEDLVEAALLLLHAHPELITRDAVWQKIIQDTAKALSDSRLDMPELLPEMLRLMLLHTADNVDLLTDVKPNSRQYVLTVAMEQCLRAIAKKPKRGKWKPQLSRPQILEILTLCLETMLQNPLWTKDKLLQLTLESIFEALQAVPDERKWAYASIRFLIENGLKAVSSRKNLVIEVVHRQGRRQVIGLTYALEGLLVTLYEQEEDTAVASWTLTQTKVLDAILDSFLQGLVEGPITKEAINEALEPVRDAVEDLAENAAFSLEDLLVELEQ